MMPYYLCLYNHKFAINSYISSYSAVAEYNCEMNIMCLCIICRELSRERHSSNAYAHMDLLQRTLSTGKYLIINGQPIHILL